MGCTSAAPAHHHSITEAQWRPAWLACSSRPQCSGRQWVFAAQCHLQRQRRPLGQPSSAAWSRRRWQVRPLEERTSGGPGRLGSAIRRAHCASTHRDNETVDWHQPRPDISSLSLSCLALPTPQRQRLPAAQQQRPPTRSTLSRRMQWWRLAGTSLSWRRAGGTRSTDWRRSRAASWRSDACWRSRATANSRCARSGSRTLPNTGTQCVHDGGGARHDRC